MLATFGGSPRLHRAALSILLGFVFASFAATKASGQGPAVSFNVPATIFTSQIGPYLPVYVAIEKGYFKAEGLNPNFITEQGGGQCIRAITASDAPFGICAVAAVLAAVEAGEPLKLVGQPYRFGTTYAVVRADSKVVKPADIKGTKIGVSRPGSGSETLAKTMLAKLGISDKDVQLVYLGATATILTSMDQGVIDVGVGSGEVLLAKRTAITKDWRLLAYAEDFVPTTEIGVVAKISAIQKDGKVIAGFFRALKKGKEFIAKNPNSDELVQMVAKIQQWKPEDLPAVREAVRQLTARQEAAWGDFSFGQDRKEFVAFTKELVSQGALKQAPAKIDVYFDDQFVK